MANENRNLGVANSTTCGKTIAFQYNANTVTQAFWIAPWPCKVTQIYGRPRVAGSGGACTFSFYKVPNATAVGSGTLLHSGTYDLVGTADTNQELTGNLVSNQDSLTLKETDALGLVLTGTPTSAVGCITISVEPLS